MAVLIVILCISCRSITHIRGFSRDTLVAIMANVESREWKEEWGEGGGSANTVGRLLTSGHGRKELRGGERRGWEGRRTGMGVTSERTLNNTTILHILVIGEQ